MLEEIDLHIEHLSESMEKVMEHLSFELNKIRAGKASPAMLNGLMVEYYGAPTPLQQVANVSTQDARTITVQPWEKKMLSHIEKAIFEANLGITPMNDGEVIRLMIPPMSEERRVAMVKQAKASGEESKVALRNQRHKVLDFIKKQIKNGFPEDIGKKKEDDVQKIIDNYVHKIDKVIEVKEKDILTI
ncbi:MAG: ribosome recycling factor [Saprospiraceae bacterium]|nr:ribosome recycling factor [Saprospiraceae bacterium]MBK6565585.1 ribosome recycling factor [Saprospiraceae bacterium]MBK6785699.1 ribosome recycling factor [Saprospiraceae bacterium]MBK7523098.1 ribosome recycling factor [Saprospiraceae bacterium]MBK8370523.1 ribosome recycling factor [Saprospiraceae bacterium]